jgi:hypothetical protein
MTDHDFERRLRANLRELAEPASAPLRASVIGIPEDVPTSLVRRLTTGWNFAEVLRFAPLAVAAAAVVMIVLAGIGLFVRPQNVGPSPASVPPSSAASASPSAPAASAAESERVFGWPDTSENGAGLYSWDGATCGRNAGGYCSIGWMHNGYGSGDVEISVGFAGSKGPGTAVTVAGHDATYHRLRALWEKWIIDIEGTFITIQIIAEPGTSEADLAEAHAIIDSMRTEPRDNDLGFRLVFRLTTDDWDSG